MRDQCTDRLASRTLPSVPDVVSAKVSFQSGTGFPQDIPATNAAGVTLCHFPLAYCLIHVRLLQPLRLHPVSYLQPLPSHPLIHREACPLTPY